MEYYSAIKRIKTESFVGTWMDIEFVIQSEVRKQISYNTYIWDLEKWYRLTYLQRACRHGRVGGTEGGGMN